MWGRGPAQRKNNLNKKKKIKKIIFGAMKNRFYRLMPAGSLRYTGSPHQFLTGLILWPVVKFMVPDWGDKLDPGIGLSYRPDRIHIGRYDNLAGVNYIPRSGTVNFKNKNPQRGTICTVLTWAGLTVGTTLGLI
jgi:hypothetical protein